jgi:perosamine synthetase
MIIQIQPWISWTEIKEIFKVVKSTFITEGKATIRFEEETKKLTNSRYAMAYANGTLALYAALKSLNIGQGDEVIIPNLTFIATANAVIMAGAKPVFCEIEKEDLGISPSKIIQLINKNTKAIMPVHLYGFSCKMDDILKIGEKYNLKIIEDAAQGVGVLYKDRHVGTIGDVGVLSYYGNKTITTAEGGMILTQSEEINKTCYRLKNHGRDRKGIFIHEHIGFNFAYTDLQAAIGLAQMKKLKTIIKKKRKIFERYYEELSYIEQLEFYKIDDQKNPVYWFSSIYTKDKERLKDYLEKNGVQTRDFFYPLHLQPCYKNQNLNTNDNFTISEDIYKNSLSLPSSVILKNSEVSKIIRLIKSFYS